jgi:large subunit ribosomal protein L23
MILLARDPAQRVQDLADAIGISIRALHLILDDLEGDGYLTRRKVGRRNTYTVVADRRATKIQIRKAVEELFKVKVTKCNTLNVRGKSRRKRTLQAGKAPDWKKAIVTLKAGDKIEFA